MLKKSVAALAALLLLTYPIMVYYGLQTVGLPTVALLLTILFVVRIITTQQVAIAELKYLAWFSATLGIILLLLGVLFKQHGWITFYPVIVNICMLLFFSISLKQPQSIIERLARLQQAQLPLSAVRYTRQVTKVWCLFFIINGSIALYTCFQPIKTWTIYNGFISYLLIGTLFAIEWLIRQHYMKKQMKKNS